MVPLSAVDHNQIMPATSKREESVYPGSSSSWPFGRKDEEQMRCRYLSRNGQNSGVAIFGRCVSVYVSIMGLIVLFSIFNVSRYSMLWRTDLPASLQQLLLVVTNGDSYGIKPQNITSF